MAVLCFFPQAQSRAESPEDLFKDLPEEYAEKAEKCFSENFLKKIQKINPSENNKTKKLKSVSNVEPIEPEKLEENIQRKCATNTFTRTGLAGVKHNLFEPFSKREVLKIGRFTEKKTMKAGVCESAYEAIFLTYKDAAQFRSGICKEFAEHEMEISDCLNTDLKEKICVSKLNKMIDAVTKLQERNTAALSKIKSFLAFHEKSNGKAIDKFKTDSEVLVSLTLDQLNLPSYSGPRGLIIASDFGTLQLKEYLSLVGSGRSSISSELETLNLTEHGQLVQEQMQARLYLTNYALQLESLFKTKEADFDTRLSQLSEQLKKLQLALDEGPSYIEKIQKYTPVAATAGQQLLQKSPVSGGSGIAGATALAALGAGAAMGSQVAGSKTTSDGSSLEMNPNIQTPAEPLGKTNLSEDTPPSNRNPSEPDSVAKPTDTKAESGPTTTTAVASAPGAPVFSSGASFKQNGFKPKNGKNGETSDASAAKSDEALKPFGGELFSPPAPKKVDTSGDVSSLLGQMKDLFNFDEPPPGAFPGAPEGFGQATPDELAATTGENPAEEGNFDGSEYTGEQGSGRQYASAEEEIIGSPLQSRSYLGGIETPLFNRVKNRHKKCMEKGLVILGLGRITE